MTVVTTEPASLTTSFGAALTVYVDVFRDADTNEVVAANPKVRDAHGNAIPPINDYLRKQRSALFIDERPRDRSQEVFIP